MLANKVLINWGVVIAGIRLETKSKKTEASKVRQLENKDLLHTFPWTLWNIFSNRELHADFIKKSGKIK